MMTMQNGYDGTNRTGLGSAAARGLALVALVTGAATLAGCAVEDGAPRDGVTYDESSLLQADDGELLLLDELDIAPAADAFLDDVQPAPAVPEDDHIINRESAGKEDHANVVYSQYYWWLPYRGGSGGGSFSISCYSGEVAVGVYGRVGAQIDRLGLICAPMYSDGSLGPASTRGSVGGGGGSPFYSQCPAGQTLVGYYGRSGSVLDQIQIACSPPVHWRTYGWITYIGPAYGGGGGGSFADFCPSSYAVTSLSGRSGALVDGIQARCNYYIP